jgi:hypothetical protein
MEPMPIHSLSATIDRVNQAYFDGVVLGKTAHEQAVKTILSRAGAANSYGRNTFGLTPVDERSRTHTFTGEGLTSPASRNHIHAEEACRCLILLNRTAKRRLVELDSASQALLEMIQRGEAKGKAKGTFCCGPCTVALWRHLAVGGLGSYAKNLDAGLGALATHRDDNGSWRRFPFFYTLSALAEVPELQNAKRAIRYALPECEKRLAKLKPTSEFSRRRRRVLERILESNG